MSAYMGNTLGLRGRETKILNLAGHFSMSKSSGGLSGRLSIGRLLSSSQNSVPPT